MVRLASRGSHRDRQVHTQPEQGNLLVLDLAAALRRLGADAGWLVADDDSCLNLISVLAAWPRPARSLDATLTKQVLRSETGWMFVALRLHNDIVPYGVSI